MTSIKLVFILLFAILINNNSFAASVEQSIIGLYVAYYNRAPDQNGFNYWVNQAHLNGDNVALLSISAGFKNNEKFKQDYPNQLSNSQFVTKIYNNILNRAPDTDGLNYWVSQLDNGLAKHEFIVTYVNNILNYTGTVPEGISSQRMFSNKIEVGQYYIDTLNDASNGNVGTLAYARSVDVLACITSDISSVNAAKELTRKYLTTNEPIENNCGTGTGTLNHAPVAQPITITSNLVTMYIEEQLSANDIDGDRLSYYLESAETGNGYSFAYINPDSGKVYVTLTGEKNEITLSYKVSDGLLFSNVETITIRINQDNVQTQATGLLETPIEVLTAQPMGSFGNATTFGAADGTLGLPSRIDLSNDFPIAGDQGQINSCVAWAVGYGLKSYQEHKEEGWALNSTQTIFSPSWLYNQLNGGRDGGSQIYDAMALIVEKGAATLSTMPYTENYLIQPSSTAREEASRYKAKKYFRITGRQQIKQALSEKFPVVIGIITNESIFHLSKSNPVFNTTGGVSSRHGRHAVTIVGYDDNKYGGAYKILNSWGTTSGDNGYFWMPYQFAESNAGIGTAESVLMQSWVLIDAPNTGNDSKVEPTTPTADNLPNLQIKTWNATYDERPGGNGFLSWEVINTGTATAQAGWDLNLILSKDDQLDVDDQLVFYETIDSSTIKTGGGLIRSEEKNNLAAFKFPEDLRDGKYYMGLWIDDRNVIKESNENDNKSMGSGYVTIRNTLPDISIYTWGADWDNAGNGILTYQIDNQGVATLPSGWDVNLVLSSSLPPTANSSYYLFYETTSFELVSGDNVYRDFSNPAYFKINYEQAGSKIPDGTYYMSLWVDDLSKIAESNESNNVSTGNNTVSISNGRSARKAQNKAQKAQNNAKNFSMNGKKLPSRSTLIKRVELRTLASGHRQMRVLKTTVAAKGNDSQQKRKNKVMKAADVAIFPVQKSISMPKISKQLSGGK